MLKTVFFDLGNVIVFFNRLQMLQQMAHCTGLSPEAIRTILVDEKVQDSYESGQIDGAGFYQIFQARSPASFTFRDFLDAMSDIFTPNASLYPLVEDLKEKGLRLILLSNTSECHYNRVYAHFPVLRLFDESILSFEVGALKPSPLIFQKALAKAECSPEHCFYTDDIPEFVAAARKAGLDSEIFTGIEDLKLALNHRMH